MIWRIAYISRRCITDDEVADLLAEARVRNASEDISGVLLADRTHFVQVAEGSRAAIADLTLRLMGDPRHSEVRFIASGADEVRWFSDWKMALVVPSSHAEALERRFGQTEFEGAAAFYEALMATVEAAEMSDHAIVQYG